MPDLDLIAAIALTASAAVVVGTLATIFSSSPQERARIAGGFAGWFALLVALAAFGAFDPVSGVGTIGLGIAIVLPAAVMAALVLGSAERRAALAAVPLPTLIGIHWVRVLGIFFVLLYAAGRLPAPFAPSAGWGDIFIGVTALPAAYAVAREVAGWRGLAVVWSVLGALDLITAIGLGITSAPDAPIRLFVGVDTAVMTTLPWIIIPGFLVPTLFVTHIAVLARLVQGRSRGGLRDISPATVG